VFVVEGVIANATVRVPLLVLAQSAENYKKYFAGRR
jgi:hypothetical protein